MCTQKEQLQVTDVVVLIDREQGGAQHLAKNNLNLHAAFKLSAMLDVLQKHQLVDEQLAGKVRQFIAENQTQLPSPAAPTPAAAAPPAAFKRFAVAPCLHSTVQQSRMERNRCVCKMVVPAVGGQTCQRAARCWQ
jgi:hypothetical protein